MIAHLCHLTLSFPQLHTYGPFSISLFLVLLTWLHALSCSFGVLSYAQVPIVAQQSLLAQGRRNRHFFDPHPRRLNSKSTCTHLGACGVADIKMKLSQVHFQCIVILRERKVIPLLTKEKPVSSQPRFHLLYLFSWASQSNSMWSVYGKPRGLKYNGKRWSQLISLCVHKTPVKRTATKTWSKPNWDHLSSDCFREVWVYLGCSHMHEINAD